MNKDRGKNDPMHHLARLRERAASQDRNLAATGDLTKRPAEKRMRIIPVTGKRAVEDKYTCNKGLFKP